MGYRKRGPKPKPLVVQVRPPLERPPELLPGPGGGRRVLPPEHPILSLPA